MGLTKIEWCRNPDGTQGQTINPWVGCSGVGCAVDEREKCYGSKVETRQKQNCLKCWNFEPHFHFERLIQIANRKKPTGYFFSCGEMFDKEFERHIIAESLFFLRLQKQHRFYILTKQAQRLSRFSFSSNVWLGVSVNRQRDVWRIDELRKTDAAVKFVSFEPLYEYVHPKSLEEIDWIIIGGETCNGKITYEPSWHSVDRLIEYARAYRCKVFCKDNLRDVGVQPRLQEFPDVSEKQGE